MLGTCSQEQHSPASSAEHLREMLASRDPDQWKLPRPEKQACLLGTETAKSVASQPPPLPESPIQTVGVQQKIPEEIKTSKKFKSKMHRAL